MDGSETSAIRTKTPGNYPKENILRIEHGEILKSRIQVSLQYDKNKGTWHEDRYTFLISCSVFLRVRKVSDKNRRENQTTF